MLMLALPESLRPSRPSRGAVESGLILNIHAHLFRLSAFGSSGHFLKLSRSGRILRATHGHAQRELSEAELKAAYGEEVGREMGRRSSRLFRIAT